MKSHLRSILFTLLALAGTTAFAQRESFDAAVVRKAEVLVVELLAGEPTVFHNILFKLDSAELLNNSSERQVDEIATALKSDRCRDTSFCIDGHTCDLGDDAHNLKLSTERAEAIRRRLIKQGVPAERLVAQGFGETEIIDPVKAKDSPAQAEARRVKSRRVVLRRLPPDKAPAKK